ncbi:hypothetical protein ACJX0J_041470, partial [Zea mays]
MNTDWGFGSVQELIDDTLALSDSLVFIYFVTEIIFDKFGKISKEMTFNMLTRFETFDPFTMTMHVTLLIQIFGLQIFQIFVAAYNLPVHGQQRVTVCLYAVAVDLWFFIAAVVLSVAVHVIAIVSFLCPDLLAESTFYCCLQFRLPLLLFLFPHTITPPQAPPYGRGHILHIYKINTEEMIFCKRKPCYRNKMTQPVFLWSSHGIYDS